MTHPREASVKLVVAMRLMMGVMPPQSKLKPTSRQMPAAIRRLLIFLPEAVCRNLPTMAPATVCTAVGMQLMATQPPGLILFMRIVSTYCNMCCF